MKLTERDIETLKFINEFGFCEITQIMKKFELKRTRSYQIMNRLLENNFVNHQRIYHNKNGVFFVTTKGARPTDLSPIGEIPAYNYKHQLAVLNVYFKLTKEFPEATWVSERLIKRNRALYSTGRKTKHIADGILILPKKQIAIEVELTLKNYFRLKDIISGYAYHGLIDEVWYYCSQRTIHAIARVAEGYKHVRILSLN